MGVILPPPKINEEFFKCGESILKRKFERDYEPKFEIRYERILNETGDDILFRWYNVEEKRLEIPIRDFSIIANDPKNFIEIFSLVLGRHSENKCQSNVCLSGKKWYIDDFVEDSSKDFREYLQKELNLDGSSLIGNTADKTITDFLKKNGAERLFYSLGKYYVSEDNLRFSLDKLFRN
jgi:hypothetical protein